MNTAEFKDSPLGPIPQDWEVKRLGDEARINRGGSPRPIESWLTTSVDGINWIKIGDVAEGAKYICSTAERIMPEAVQFSRTVKSGDFLLSNSMSFGRPYILKISGCIHDGWLTIQDYKDTFDCEYLYYILGSEAVFQQYVALADGSSVKNLNKDKVEKVLVPCPPLPEQQRIAEALGEVDKLIKSLDEQIEKKRLIAKGVAHDLLSAKKRLPGFKGEWKTRSIEDMLTLGHGRDYKGIPNGDVPVYGTGGVMCYVAEYLYEGPTVCIGRKGTIDAPIYHDGKIWTVDTLFYSHSFKECYPKFIYYKFLTIDWQSYNEASGVPSLTADIIGRISLEVPMNVAEQQAIADSLGEQDAAIASLEAKREKYARIKEGMMRDLLTGKVRI